MPSARTRGDVAAEQAAAAAAAAAASEVMSSDDDVYMDDDDEDEDDGHYAMEFDDSELSRVASSGRRRFPARQPPHSGDWERVHDPDAPRVEDGVLQADDTMLRRRPFYFFLHASTADSVAAKLHKITLPTSWQSSTVGRLVDLLTARFGMPAWDAHLECPRGALSNAHLVQAAIVRKERLSLARGPPPQAHERDKSRTSFWLWGRAVGGEMYPNPTRQPGLGCHQVRRVSLGDEHVVIATAVGLALSWGFNDCGQLGTGYEVPVASPSVIRALAAVEVMEVACGPRCTGAIDRTGALWAWGANQPANRPKRFHSSWANASGATPCGLDCEAVAFGLAHTMVLTHTEARVWSWGYNDHYQLGWADARTSPVLRNGFQKPRDCLVEGLSACESRIVAIACGEAHSACLTAAGEVFAWGDSSTGQCGSTSGLPVFVPTPLPMPRGDTHATSLRCFGNATLVVTGSGRAYIFGGGGRIQGPSDDDDDDDDGGNSGSEAGADEEGAGGALADDDDVHSARRGDAADDASSSALVAKDSSGSTALYKGLGRLLGARLLAEGVGDAAGCEDHALLIDKTRSTCRGLGYNRYKQACPCDDSLRLAQPTPLPTGCFSHQRVLALACGGGCSVAITQPRESLAACCVAVLQEQLEAGDAEACADVLAFAAACDAPTVLSPLMESAMECYRRRPVAVAERCETAGVNSVADAIKALAATRGAADEHAGGDHVHAHAHNVSS